MGVGSGDRLARGGSKASWGPLDVSAKKWADIFGEPEKPKKKKRKGKS